MKKLTALTLSSLLAGSFAIAADVENTHSEKTDMSHNPITGSDTTTTKSKRKVKTPGGDTRDVEVKEKTKRHRDGQVDKTIKVEDDSSTKAHD